MRPNSCPQCGESLTTLWRETKKYWVRRPEKVVAYVPVYTCLTCLVAVRLGVLGDTTKLLTRKP